MTYRTHPEYLNFLKAVRAAPDDDTVRLVLADWLDENGHGGRAELIRRECSTPIPLTHPAFWYTVGQSVWSSRGFLCRWHSNFTDWCRFADDALPESVGLTVRLTDGPRWMSYGAGTVRFSNDMTTYGPPLPLAAHPAAYTLEGVLSAVWPDVAEWELPPQEWPVGGRIDLTARRASTSVPFPDELLNT